MGREAGREAGVSQAVPSHAGVLLTLRASQHTAEPGRGSWEARPTPLRLAAAAACAGLPLLMQLRQLQLQGADPPAELLLQLVAPLLRALPCPLRVL